MPKYGINKATLLGNEGTEPELRHTQQGVPICSFRLATTERRPAAGGTWQDITDWHNIVLWRQKAEIAKKILRVGSGVYLEGRIITRSWEGEDGRKRYTTEIEVDKMRVLDPAPAGENPSTTNPTGAAQSTTSPQESPQSPQEKPDDLPF